MQTIIGKRSSRKTMTLIKEANRLYEHGKNCTFIVHNISTEAAIRQAGLNENIPIISLQTYTRN